jgi:hypothetical protein
MKVVINADWGGFGLSDAAIARYAELAGLNLIAQEDTDYGWTNWYQDVIDDDHFWSERELERDDAYLVQVVEELGEAAHGQHASLKIVDIPDDVEWHVEEYDGSEWVAEDHQTWR